MEGREIPHVEPQATRETTFGEKLVGLNSNPLVGLNSNPLVGLNSNPLVGLNSNPSNDEKVSRAKQLCAELADLLHDDCENSETTHLKSILENNAYCEILNAQMNVVKVLTFKY